MCTTLLAACVPCGLAAAPTAASTWRAFEVLRHFEPIPGLAVRTDGTVLYAPTMGENSQVIRLGRGGRRSVFAGTRSLRRGLGDGGPSRKAALSRVSGLAVAPDGGVLIADSWDNLVRRVAPDGTITTVAGKVVRDQHGYEYGEAGSGGDGGAATSAQLCAPAGVAPLTSGGFLIAEMGSHVVRKVAADGTISTVAGTPGVCDATIGFPTPGPDGGPATPTQLGGPTDVAPLPDGGFLIADRGAGLRRVLPDGTITLAAAGYARSVDAMPDGRYAYLLDSQVHVASPGSGGVPIAGRPPRAPPVTSPVEAFLGSDGLDALKLEFPGGSGLPAETGLAWDPLGGLLLAENETIFQFVEPPSRRMGLAVQGARGVRRRALLTYFATAAGAVEVEVRDYSDRRLARRRRGRARAGRNTVRLRVRPGVYTITVRATAGNGTRDTDQLDLVLGGRLPIWAAATAVARYECDYGCGDAPDTTEELGRCRRLARARVDCRIDAREVGACEAVGSAVLRPTGFIWTRRYPCPIRRVLRRPRPLAPAPLP
jgi:hypothetical protein